MGPGSPRGACGDKRLLATSFLLLEPPRRQGAYTEVRSDVCESTCEVVWKREGVTIR